MISLKEYDKDRFDRSKRISWIDINKIKKARVLVAGAGALGNEVVKDLVLSGFRDITVIDMDDIVRSNLNRCVFFREDDVGGDMKSDVLARRASELDRDVRITPKVMRIQENCDWNFDAALGCLDNISARLHLNSHCRFYGIPYVDGATDGLRGKIQVVLKKGPCLECTMNKTHAKVIDERFSCTGQNTFVPKMAAEITTTSVVAAMQVREALKIISAREDLCIMNAVYYDGSSGEMQTLVAETDPKCPNHTEVNKWE